jgi:bacillithiol biosynthesis cysteine-adding enzyme BshC
VATDPQGSAVSESSVKIPVDVRRFAWVRRLAADYAYDFRSLEPFFTGDPRSPSAWTETIARTQAHERHRDAIAQVIATQQHRRRASARAREAGDRLADPRTVAVVTGQQAGLFGGPVFTLLKALTALQLAERVSREHRVPTVAVFWVESEDHDWEEVRSCTVLNDRLVPCTVALPARQGTEPVPIARMALPSSMDEVIAELMAVLPRTEFSGWLTGLLRDAYSDGCGMADAFAVWLERVLGDRGLVVYDASDPASKPLAAGVFARELATPGTTAALAAAAGSALQARGYHVQVTPQADGLALFRMDNARRSIRQQDGQLIVGDESYTQSALIQEVSERPAAFSPGVLLRPIVQDTLFPTVCYVAGPNELAYLGQLRHVYEHFGVPMPIMYPRATATILDSASLRFINKYKVAIEALQPQDESALNALLETQIPAAVEESFSGASATIDAQMTRLMQAVPAIDPTLEGAAKSTLGRMQHDLQTLHGKIIQAAKRRDDTLRRQFIHARALVFPDGHAQERAIGFVSFLNQYGPALIDRLTEELPLEIGRHWLVTI